MSVDKDLIAKVVSRRLSKRAELSETTPLISGGLIDSMAIIDLILDLQDAFSVQIPVSEVQPDDFDTVRKIADTLTRFQ